MESFPFHSILKFISHHGHPAEVGKSWTLNPLSTPTRLSLETWSVFKREIKGFSKPVYLTTYVPMYLHISHKLMSCHMSVLLSPGRKFSRLSSLSSLTRLHPNSELKSNRSQLYAFPYLLKKKFLPRWDLELKLESNGRGVMKRMKNEKKKIYLSLLIKSSFEVLKRFL